tara:strand:- start:713 stop:1774 length:1062 start_codon:yes stop_codon:yes gene_type:complete
MKIGFWCREDELLNNFVFLNNGLDASYNHAENYWHNFYLYLKNKNHEIISIDQVENIDSLDCVVFLDFPAGRITKLAKKALSHRRKILIAFENEVVVKNNWIKKNHDLFDIILTWNDDFIDNKKYFKLVYPVLSQHKKLYDFIPFIDKENLSCMISWKKIYNNQNETQSIKKNIINYFENNNFSNDFHLYGPNWNEKVFSYSSFFKFLNYPRFKLLRKFLLRNKLSTWKGISEDKQKTISNYKFVFCIENGINYNGYFTDKIFECFYSGTVPIYLGALNVKLYIPQECYIDYRKFKNIRDLHEFLLNIDLKTYEKYISNISSFLKNNNNSIFTYKYFNETVLNSIDSLVKNKF